MSGLRAAENRGKVNYAQLGMMTIEAGMEGEVDTMLRRSAFKVRQGLNGEIVPTDLLARAVNAEEAGMTAPANGKLRKRGVDGSRSTA